MYTGNSVDIRVNRKRFVEIIDTLVDQKRKNLFPFNTEKAVVPQVLIPEEIRKDKKVHALFYFFTCIYMRGGIESHTAFKQLIKMWFDHPEIISISY